MCKGCLEILGHGMEIKMFCQVITALGTVALTGKLLLSIIIICR